MQSSFILRETDDIFAINLFKCEGMIGF